MALTHVLLEAGSRERQRLHLSVLCPCGTCDGRVDFEARTFHGVPMTGNCSSCGSPFELSGGSLRALGKDATA